MSGTRIQQFLLDAKNRLLTITETPLLEAEILLAHALKKPRSFLFAHQDHLLENEILSKATHYVDRRVNHEPIAYITGVREFWSLDLKVTPATLIPRPDTETLVEVVLKCLPQPECLQVLDLGTGSGAIAIALAHERPNWQIYAADICEKALSIAEQNAHALEVVNISFLQSNWFSALPTAEFDAIVSNPPYLSRTEWQLSENGLRYEPYNALVSDANGLGAINVILSNAKVYLKSSGYVIVEHGYRQGKAVRDLFLKSGYQQIRSISDLSGHERVTLGVK